MSEKTGNFLTRDEIALLHFYRGLSFEKQFELLEGAEGNFNAAKRMEILCKRDSERPIPQGDCH